MKKLIYLFVLGIGFTACSVESLDSTENLLTADAKAKLQATETSYTFSGPETICAGEEVQFSFDASIGTNLQVQQYNSEIDDWEQVYHTSKSTENPQYFTLSWSTSGEYLLRYKPAQGGIGNGPEVSVNVLDCNDCEESFTYVENEDGTYTFTYIPAEDLNEAEVVFTFAQSVVASGYEWPTWNGNSSTRTEIMNLVACEVYTWNLSLSADCNGKSGKSNVWTDFKVNDVSKKADEDDKFVVSCN